MTVRTTDLIRHLSRVEVRVTDFLEQKLSPGSYDFYLCGRGEMVRDATHIIDRRFPGARVFSELFF
jgi:ferredoxin-NADP reductase